MPQIGPVNAVKNQVCQRNWVNKIFLLPPPESALLEYFQLVGVTLFPEFSRMYVKLCARNPPFPQPGSYTVSSIFGSMTKNDFGIKLKTYFRIAGRELREKR